MANMTSIPATIDGVAYTFQILEADIPALTYGCQGQNYTDADFNSFSTMCRALGLNNSDERYAFVFNQVIVPKGDGDTNQVLPVGKPLLARVANMVTADRGASDLTKAVLYIALKGGGMAPTNVAVSVHRITRAHDTAVNAIGNRVPFVSRILVPQILNAAAAA
jgi:hypothetical protein